MQRTPVRARPRETAHTSNQEEMVNRHVRSMQVGRAFVLPPLTRCFSTPPLEEYYRMQREYIFPRSPSRLSRQARGRPG